MKIVFLQQYFYPDVAGSAIRLTELAVALEAARHEVTAYAGYSGYTGKRHTLRKETYDGIIIERLGKGGSNKNTLLGRAVTSISFFISAFWQVLIKTDQRTLLLISSEPPFLPLIGWFMNKLRKQKYILRVADLYPQIAVALGYLKQGNLIDRTWLWANRLSYKRAEKIITLGDGMRRRILEDLGNIEESKVSVIHNWENEDLIRPLPKEDNWFAKKYGLLNKTVLLYSGNMGVAHDLLHIMEAACRLRDEKEICFLFLGDGKQRHHLMQLANKHQLDNVLFLPYQPRDYLPYSLTAGDIGLISMKSGTEGLCMPGKFYSALASGSAVLAVVPQQSEIAEMIQRFQYGLCVEPSRPEEIANAILKLHKNPTLLKMLQRNARSCFEKYFTKERAMNEHLQLLQSVSQ